jgi:hypothetical protein
MEVGGQYHAPAALPQEEDPVPIVQEARWAPGLVWMGVENLASTGLRSPDHAACSKSM